MATDAAGVVHRHALTWLDDRLLAVLRTHRKAVLAGQPRAGHAFVIATTRLIGLLWLEQILDPPICHGYRFELALAWRAFRKRRRALEELGIIAADDLRGAS